MLTTATGVPMKAKRLRYIDGSEDETLEVPSKRYNLHREGYVGHSCKRMKRVGLLKSGELVIVKTYAQEVRMNGNHLFSHWLSFWYEEFKNGNH